MTTSNEYAAWRKKTTLPDGVTMLARAGIDPHSPHEFEVMRMTKTAGRALSKRTEGGTSPDGEKLRK